MAKASIPSRSSVVQDDRAVTGADGALMCVTSLVQGPQPSLKLLAGPQPSWKLVVAVTAVAAAGGFSGALSATTDENEGAIDGMMEPVGEGTVVESAGTVVESAGEGAEVKPAVKGTEVEPAVKGTEVEPSGEGTVVESAGEGTNSAGIEAP